MSESEHERKFSELCASYIERVSHDFNSTQKTTDRKDLGSESVVNVRERQLKTRFIQKKKKRSSKDKFYFYIKVKYKFLVFWRHIVKNSKFLYKPNDQEFYMVFIFH